MKEDLLKELNSVAKEVALVAHTLMEDINICLELNIDKNKTNFWRRTYIRAFFAHIEGMSFQFKRVALSILPISSFKVTEAEKILLREETYELDNKGEAKVTRSKVRVSENLLFSTRMVSKLCGSGFLIDKNSLDWNNFKTALKIRDRITHPKTSNDIEISDTEIKIVENVGSWFFGVVNKIADIVEEFENDFKIYSSNES